LNYQTEATYVELGGRLFSSSLEAMHTHMKILCIGTVAKAMLLQPLTDHEVIHHLTTAIVEQHQLVMNRRPGQTWIEKTAF